MDPVDRLSKPLDYQVLWGRLAAAVKQAAAGQAQRAATEKDDVLVRRAQGAYAFSYQILEIMKNLVDEERGPVFDESEDPDSIH